MNRVSLPKGVQQRLIGPPQDDIFLAVGKSTGNRRAIGHAALQGGCKAFDTVPKAVGKVADFSCILLNYTERQRIRLATQFHKRWNERQHEHQADHEEQSGHCEIGIHKTFRKRSVLSQ